MKRFRDRQDAGRRLAEKLIAYKQEHPLIFALPRGGVPIAAVVAEKLQAPLDLLLVRKLGTPENPELAMGAISEDRMPRLNDKIVRYLNISESEIREILEKEVGEIERQAERYRGGRPLLEAKDKTVIIVDDGLATGATIKAAVQTLQGRGAKKVIVAVPVAASASAKEVREIADDLVTVLESDQFYAVGAWYDEFSQVSDDEVLAFLKQTQSQQSYPVASGSVLVMEGNVQLPGLLEIPDHPKGLILFVHGSGSSHKSPRNLKVAQILNKSGFATLLFDLLTEEESRNRDLVFDVQLLGERLLMATKWLRGHLQDEKIPFAYFGASTGAAAALIAAARRPPDIFAVVSRGGRPDLAGKSLELVQVPVLLIVGERDESVIELNQRAKLYLQNVSLVIIPGANHIFSEPGTLEKVAAYAKDWFSQYVPAYSGMITAERHSKTRPTGQ